MPPRRAGALAAVAGVALGLLFLAFALAPTPPTSTGCGHLMPIDTVLSMHPELPGMSGNRSWYNTTVTLNRSIPLDDLVFGFVDRQDDSVLPPPAFDFTVYHEQLPIAGFNLTTHNWTSGASRDLLAGDWFGVQVYNENLAGEKLVAFGVLCYSSTTSVVFQ